MKSTTSKSSAPRTARSPAGGVIWQRRGQRSSKLDVAVYQPSIQERWYVWPHPSVFIAPLVISCWQIRQMGGPSPSAAGTVTAAASAAGLGSTAGSTAGLGSAPWASPFGLGSAGGVASLTAASAAGRAGAGGAAASAAGLAGAGGAALLVVTAIGAIDAIDELRAGGWDNAGTGAAAGRLPAKNSATLGGGAFAQETGFRNSSFHPWATATSLTSASPKTNGSSWTMLSGNPSQESLILSWAFLNLLPRSSYEVTPGRLMVRWVR